MTADGFGHVDDGLDTAVGGPEVPPFEIQFSPVWRLDEEILKDEAYLVGASGFQVAAGEIEGSEFLFLIGGEVFGVLEPEIASA